MCKKLVLLFIATFFLATEVRSQSFIKSFASVSAFAQFGNGMLFAGDDGVHGPDLWKTDGTVAGTVMVKNVNIGPNGAVASSIIVFNGKAYFAANDGIHATQLWQSDGTTDGTILFKNIGPTASGNGLQPSEFTIFNNLLYFVATSDGFDFSLWKTDGTAAGTVQVTDNSFSSTSQLIAVGNMLYFVDNGLWQSDGTATGTKKIVVDNNQLIGMLTKVNNNLVFTTDDNFYAQNVNLYALSPIIGTPVLLQSFNPGTYNTSTIDNVTAVGSNFFFSIRTSGLNINGTDVLWTSDCTATGTKTVATYNWPPGIAYNYMRNFKSFNNNLYFASTSAGSLFQSDGTLAGTGEVSSLPVDQQLGSAISNGKLYFISNTNLFSYNGTTTKKELTYPGHVSALFDDNGLLYFTSLSNNAYSLWNNVAAGQLQVNINTQTLVNAGTSAITSKPDSIVTNQVTVTNTGSNTLVFSEIGISGDSFYVNGTPNQTLAPGGKATFNLLYSPLKEEQVSAVLSIKSNDNSGRTLFAYNFTGNASGRAAQTSPNPSGGFEKEIVFADSAASFSISNNVIAESSPLNSPIGSFELTNGAGYQYQLITGDGSNDNGNFIIKNNILQSAAVFNFATKNTYSIRVQATDGKTTIQKVFAIQVTNQQVNLAPTCADAFQNLTYSLNDVTYVGNRIVAVASGGIILNSDDNGQTWKRINSGVLNNFNKVEFTSSKTGYILSSSPPMLKTEDSGNTWFPLDWPPSPQYAPGFTDMYFVSDSVGYVVTNGNAYYSSSVYKTINGGRSWKQLSFNSYFGNFNSVWFTDANNGFICGSSSLLVHTTDGGKSWQPITVTAAGSGASFNNITFVNATVGYMTSMSGYILQTLDGGNTWARISTIPTDGNIDRIYFRDANNGYVLAGFNSAALYVTADGGHSWNFQSVGQAGVFTALAFNQTASNICLIGHAGGLGGSSLGSVIYLGNGSDPWIQQSYFGSDNYLAGNLFASGTGYVFGTNNLKTTDGGVTWKPLNIAIPYGNYLKAGVFLNADTGFYADNYNLYKSIDGGKTWVLKNTHPTAPVSMPITFYKTKLGFYANDQTLYQTNDGGETWSVSLTPTGLGLRTIYIADQNTIYTTGIGTPLYKSSDGGKTWTSTNFASNQIILSLNFTDALTGLAGGTNGLLMRTTDGGITWTPLVTSMRLDILDLQFIDKLHGYAYTAYDEGQGGAQIYETIDGGINWNLIFQPGNGYGLPVFQLTDGQLFVAGAGGWMMKLNSNSLPPVNAGYIAGDTIVASGVKTIYSVASVPNTHYKWVAAGAKTVEYHDNQIIISWPKGGNYALQVTPYNDCGSGQSRTLNINVEDMPAPQVTGPDTVDSFAVNVIYTTAASNNAFNWTATNDVSIMPLLNQATVNWGKPGNGTVTVVETSSSLNMQKSSVLNVVIKQSEVSLPSSNFTVAVTSASCRGSANGSISIKAQAPLNYTAAITGPGGFVKNQSFTDSLNVGGLDTGAYNICITIVGNNLFQRCYTVAVTQPKTLAAYTVVNQTTKTITIDLTGAETYFINLNGQIHQTNANQVNLSLNNGPNQLAIYTDKPCQGVIQKVVNMNVITIYPVPFIDVLNIDLGGSKVSMAGVMLTDAFGKIVYNKDSISDNGKLQVDVSNLMVGTYILKLTLGSTSVVFKVLKQ